MSPPMPRSLHPPFLLATAAILALGIASTYGGGAALAPLLAMASLLALAIAWRRVARVAHAGDRAQTALLRSTQDTLALLRLTESLQRCRAVEEVAHVVEDVARKLLPTTELLCEVVNDRYGVRDCQVPTEYRQGQVRTARAGK